MSMYNGSLPYKTGALVKLPYPREEDLHDCIINHLWFMSYGFEKAPQ
jgi:hypothetical protein